jgi:hypothetical protein
MLYIKQSMVQPYREKPLFFFPIQVLVNIPALLAGIFLRRQLKSFVIYCFNKEAFHDFESI